MIRKYMLPVLAATGFGFAVVIVVKGSKTLPPAPPVVAPSMSPYLTFVAGAGLVEASTENIAIGTQLAGIVSKIYVAIGDRVKTGDPLFLIDDRATRAELATRRAAVKVAEADLANAKNQLALAESLTDKRAMSVEELDNRRYAVQTADAKLTQAQTDLQATQTTLERLTVHAPVDGQVLQVKVHVGEFAPTGVLAQPLVLLGNVEPLCVRVDVDENDAWRVRPNTAAVAYLRGNNQIKVPLKFVRFEPYVIPKQSLTGESTERVDTRVLQVIYSFDRADLPIYTGQQMDIYIEAPGHDEGGKS